jgi:hypothetical protein
MVSGGVSIVPGIALDEQVFYLSGKARFVNVEYVQAAVGVFWVHAGSTDESAGAVFGTVTAGSDIASFTGSLGFPFATASGFEEKPLVYVIDAPGSPDRQQDRRQKKSNGSAWTYAFPVPIRRPSTYL